MNREDLDPEMIKAYHEEVKMKYKEVLQVTNEDEFVVNSTFKISKVSAEIDNISEAFYNQDITAFQAVVGLEVLLGALGEVRKDLREIIFPKNEK
jgi:ribosomal protein L31